MSRRTSALKSALRVKSYSRRRPWTACMIVPLMGDPVPWLPSHLQIPNTAAVCMTPAGHGTGFMVSFSNFFSLVPRSMARLADRALDREWDEDEWRNALKAAGPGSVRGPHKALTRSVIPLPEFLQDDVVTSADGLRSLSPVLMGEAAAQVEAVVSVLQVLWS